MIAEVINIEAQTVDAAAYVDVSKNNSDIDYDFVQHTSNVDFDTNGKISVSETYEYKIYVGSSNLINGEPDEIQTAILRIKRLKSGEVPSDLLLTMRVSHLENDSGRLATVSSYGGSLADPASYEVLINQNAVTAYINVTNNSRTTNIYAYYPIDEDGNVAEEDLVAGPGV